MTTRLLLLPDEIETPNFLHQEDYKTMDDFFAAVAEWLIYELAGVISDFRLL